MSIIQTIQVKDCPNIRQMNFYKFRYSINLTLCCERVIAHEVINIQRAQNMGERIFTGAHLCYGVNGSVATEQIHYSSIPIYTLC